LILISDGQDNNSKYTFKQVREALKESNVLLYSVNLSNDYSAGSSLGLEGQDILRDLSLQSGGMFFYKKESTRLKLSDAASVFEIIATELRHQYSIEIAPQALSPNLKWHKVRIQTKSPVETKGWSVRTREGFYASPL
jgi:Ca-activated chloride channel homolog